MSQTFKQKIQDAITGTVRKSTYLVSIEFDEVTIRLSSRDLVEYNGYQWSDVGLTVQRFRSGRGGSQSASISIPNHEYTWSAIVLANQVAQRPVTIYRLFGDPPYAVDDAKIFFEGVISAVPTIGADVIITCATKNANLLRIPNVFIGPPYVNHMPKSGDVIEWKDQKFILQARRDD